MLSLRSFHLFFILLSIVVASGFGTWGVLHQYVVPGALSLGLGLLLVGYGGYFAWKAENIHLR